MIEIQLSQNQVTQVDDEGYEWLSAWNWYVKKQSGGNQGDVFYSVRNEVIGRRPYRTTVVRMHVEIWEHHNGISVPEGYTVDHIDRNPLNNQYSNLRLATPAQQQQNKGMSSRNTSGFIGVHLHRQTGKYRAVISVDKKPIHLGLFDDSEEAARVRDRAATEYFGEFAVLNFPNGNE